MPKEQYLRLSSDPHARTRLCTYHINTTTHTLPLQTQAQDPREMLCLCIPRSGHSLGMSNEEGRF